MEDIDGDNACAEADQAGEQNQSPVVLGSKAGENAEHVVIRPRLFLPVNTLIRYLISLTPLQLPGAWLLGRKH